tara:strand:- start:627 stop:1094 length:468 start_codon:yes stop_codon:yes gene_type:complete
MKQDVTIDAIYEPKADKNQDYVTIQCRAIIDRPSSLTGVAKMYVKGGDFVENRVAFFSIHRDIAAEYKFVAGGNISDLTEVPQSIQVTELADSTFVTLSEDDKRGFSKKLNPETKAMCLSAGEQVWRKSELVETSEFVDTLLATDKVKETVALKV